MKVVEDVLNLIYPPSLYCICCGNIIDETRIYSLCDHCLEHIHWLNQYEEKSKGDMGDNLVCKNLDRVYSCAQYGLYTRNIVFNLKYNKKTYIARIIGKIMADKLNLYGRVYDYIIGVPMFKAKEKKRGFNHAGLIAKYLGKELEVEVRNDMLVRVVDTKPMRGLNPTEREYNIKNVFIFSEKFGKIIDGKSVLIVDDIFTTGSTGAECARIVLEAGAKSVDFIAFASGNDDINS